MTSVKTSDKAAGEKDSTTICDDVDQSRADENTILVKRNHSPPPPSTALESLNTTTAGRSDNDDVVVVDQEQELEAGISAEIEMQTNQKQGRKRKKHLFNAIRSQMEFYFGDANLSKDRFLKQLIDKDPFVPLEVFLNFNKLKILTQSVEHIAKSLSNSQLLELDETGQKVRRKTVIDLGQNVDSKTLYVEALPANADHDWVRHVFERFGPVAYVSLPRYPTSRKIKEFGFIEFKREASVEKAVKAFQQFDAVLSLQTSDPAELQSVRAYIHEQQEKNDNKDTTNVQEKECSNIKKAIREVNLNEQKKEVEDEQQQEENTPLTIKKSKKRRKPLADSLDEKLEEENGISKKRLKTSEKDEVGKSNETEQKQTEQECVADASGGGESSEAIPAVAANDDKNKEEESDADAEAKKRLKKKKKKFNQLEMDPSCFDLRILPKCDWKRLRNKYLNLQREKIRELKQHWRNQHQQQHQYSSSFHPQHHYSSSYHSQHQQRSTSQQLLQQEQHLLQSMDESTRNIQEHESLNDEDANVSLPAKRLKSDVHKMSMNFYGAGGGEPDDNTTATAGGSASNLKGDGSIKEEYPIQHRVPLFAREPGLIVEILLLEPCVNIKDFKADMRQYASVKYVDIKEGAMQANLRLESASAAEELVLQLNCAEYKCKVLHGKAETRYWRKIEMDREMKLNKKIKVPQKRGREKIKKLLVGSHIHFKDEDNDEDHDAQTDVVDGGAAVLPFNSNLANE